VREQSFFRLQGSLGYAAATARAGLSKASKRLLASGSLVNAGFAATSVFVPLFFYTVSGSITKMALYSVGNYCGLTVGFLAVARLFPTTSPRRLFRSGLGLSALFFCALILLRSHAGPLALQLGVLSGVAAGTYWVGANTLVYDVLGRNERGHYYGLSFAITSMLNVVMPLSAGFLVQHLSDGFLAVFGVAAGSFVAAWWVAGRLSDTPGMGGTELGQVFAAPLVSGAWARMWLALGARGFKQAAGGLGLIVLIALATHSSAAQGEFVAVASLAGVATSLLAGRLRARSQAFGMWAGAVGFAAATALLFFHAGFEALLIYGGVTGFVYPGLMVPLAAVTLEVIDTDPAAPQTRGLYILSQEVGLNAGRVGAVVLLLALIMLTSPVEAVLAVLSIAAGLQLAAAHLGSTALRQTYEAPQGLQLAKG
jgi:YQGE family putative transporter